ncbi:serpin B10-like [Palaemon carinicauda]|uniref:serpin B10-like n=1 Tax=Palaemon carinicauda TaxID=392227 RepID=UPI0035B6088A
MKWNTSTVLLPLLLVGIVSGAQLMRERHPQLKCPDTRLVTIYPDMSDVMDFQMEFFQRLAVPSGEQETSARRNFLMSPYSVWSGLVMAYIGARNETQRQMEEVLKLSDKSWTFYLWRELGSMFEAKEEEEDALYEFTMVNRAYFNESLEMNSLAMDLMNNEMRVFNSNNPSGTVQEINSFVSDATRGRIPETVTEADMERAQMVLVNTAYFNGRWIHHFDATQTARRNFSVDSQTNVYVDMMRQTESFRYGASESLAMRILEMRYKGSDISMFVLMPNPEIGPIETRLDTMMRGMTGSSLRAMMDGMRVEVVELQMPKFKFEMKMCEEMQQALMDMGLTNIFDHEMADMSAFTTSTTLNVDKVIHKNHIEVNEDGTEAAAGTGLISSVLSAQIPVKPVLFHCNEPFFYMVFDKRTNNMLFMGTYRNPADI